MSSVYNRFISDKKNGRKSLAVLIDPDKCPPGRCHDIAIEAMSCGLDYFFVGSSLLKKDHLDNCIRALKQSSSIPVILFPGNIMQVSEQADAILFLSLISGRNPELLIGNHVIAAPMIRNSGLEVIPTGYMLIDSGAPTSVSYMSNTFPIPHDKCDIAECTAMAGEMLGLSAIYLDAGSGARYTVSPEMIRGVQHSIKLPLIVGGGIRSAQRAMELYDAGADILVVGNALESETSLMSEISGRLKETHTRDI